MLLPLKYQVGQHDRTKTVHRARGMLNYQYVWGDVGLALFNAIMRRYQ